VLGGEKILRAVLPQENEAFELHYKVLRLQKHVRLKLVGALIFIV
jgi:hypothetical protein